MGYGEWLIKHYPHLRYLTAAELQRLIAGAKWRTRLARVLACALCIEIVFYCALHALRHWQSGSWLQEFAILLAILGAGLWMCDRAQAAIVKTKLSMMVRSSPALAAV